MAEKKHRLRRTLTALTLLATGVALLAAVAFFLLRAEYPALAIAFGKVVWVSLIATIAGGGALTVAGALQALFAPDPEAEGEAGPAAKTPSE